MSASAALWYVDPLAVGNTNGTSWANAFTNFAGITWGTVSAGDTVYLSGGTVSQTYKDFLFLNQAGSANATNVLSTSTEAGHNGLVIIDGASTNEALTLGFTFKAAIIFQNYWRVTGMPNTNLLLANWDIGTTNSRVGDAFYVGIANHILIEGVCVSNVNFGLYSNPGGDLEVSHCSFLRVKGSAAVDVGPYQGTNPINSIVHHSRMLLDADFMGGSGGPDGIKGLNGVTIYNCDIRCTNGPVVGGEHPDGVQTLGAYIAVSNCYFANFANSGFKFEPEFGSNFVQVFAMNNVVTIDDPAFTNWPSGNGKGCELGAIASQTNVDTFVICNNTFAGLVGLGINGGTLTWPISGKGMLIENNIVYDCMRLNNSFGSAVTFTNGPSAILDFNLINSPLGGSRGSFEVDTNGGASYLADFQQLHPRTNAPVFVSYTPYAQNNDFHLAAGDTAAIGQATNLTAFTTTDRDGNPRPAVGNWTIGALQNTSVSSLALTPNIISVGNIRSAGNVRQ